MTTGRHLCIWDNAAINTQFFYASIFSPHLQRPQKVESHETGTLPCSIKSWIPNEFLWLFGSDAEEEISLSDSLSRYEESIQVFKSQKEKTSDESAAISTAFFREETDKENYARDGKQP